MSIAAHLGTLRAAIAVRPAQTQYLTRPGVLEWLYAEPGFVGGLTKESEKAWGNATIGGDTKQWTTKLSERVLHDILTLRNELPRKLPRAQRPAAANGKRLEPDWETDEALYECKARSYKTSGTAGEKIMGCPVKYSELPRLYQKPLYIVCVGYQEVEAADDFQLFQPRSEELRAQTQFWKHVLRIEVVRATSLLDAILGPPPPPPEAPPVLLLEPPAAHPVEAPPDHDVDAPSTPPMYV